MAESRAHCLYQGDPQPLTSIPKHLSLFCTSVSIWQIDIYQNQLSLLSPTHNARDIKLYVQKDSISLYKAMDVLHTIIYIIGIPHFITLHTYCLFFFFNKSVCGSLEFNKPFGPIFQTAFAHFMSLCHILVILIIFQTFSLLYLVWSSVISDIWCYYCEKIITRWRLRSWLAVFSNETFFN